MEMSNPTTVPEQLQDNTPTEEPTPCWVVIDMGDLSNRGDNPSVRGVFTDKERAEKRLDEVDGRFKSVYLRRTALNE